MTDRHLGIRVPKDRMHGRALERLDSAHLRQRPGLIIIGAQKAGTTSLYRYLSGHPDVGGTISKEVHFFSWRYERGMEWYFAHFPTQGEFALVVEASPSYLMHPLAPDRIRQVMPDVKLVALLRNPIDRAYSQYQMNFRKGIEPLSFEEAVAQEPARLHDDRAWSEAHWRNTSFVSYLTRGLYAGQLQRWLEWFPPEQLLVHASETFATQTDQVLQQTFAFAGLPPWQPACFEPHNVGVYDAMRPETRARLADHFAPHNQELYALLGRDLGWEADRGR